MTAMKDKRDLRAFSQAVSKPGPEVKKLGYFVGRWTTEGTVSQGPWGTGGEFRWTDRLEWMDGRFFLLGHSDFQMPPEVGGDGKEIYVMGFEGKQNVYTFDAFSSQGRHQASKGRLRGDTWTWVSEATYGGQDIQQKMTMKVLSPTSYQMKFEVSMDGATWMTFMEGTAAKK